MSRELWPRRALDELLLAVGLAPLGLALPLLGCLIVHGAHPSGILKDYQKICPAALVVPALAGMALSYPVRALLALRRQGRGADLRPLVAMGAAAAGASLVEAWGWVRSARESLMERPVYTGYFFCDAEAATLVSVGAGALLLAALWTLVGVVRARGQREAVALPPEAIVAPAVVVALTGYALCRASAAVEHMHNEAWEQVTEYAKSIHVFRPFVEMYDLPLLAAALGSAVILVLALRDRKLPAPREGGGLLGPAALFVVGACAFALTRGEADDAQNPPPEVSWGASLHGAEGRPLPVASTRATCDRRDWAMTASFSGEERWTTDGVRGSPWELARGDTPALVSALKRGREQEHSSTVLVVVPATTPIARLGSLFEAARIAGYRAIDAVVARPQPFETQTLGQIDLAPLRCTVTLPIGSGSPLPKAGTWGDLVR